MALLAASVERMVHLDLAIRLVAFGRFDDKLVLVTERLLFRPKVVSLVLLIL